MRNTKKGDWGECAPLKYSAVYTVHTDGFEDDTINAEILGSQLFDEVTNIVGNWPQREEADEFVYSTSK